MSQLDQAKKEAKRLFNLAKANQENTEINISQQSSQSNINHGLVIENLSKAREILSLINGYKNWHEYEEVLKRKDFMFDKVDKTTNNKKNQEIFDNQKYYIQDISFNTIINPIVSDNHLVLSKDHKPIIMGKNKEKSFFETKERKWILNQYPVLVTGSTGAGKSETLLSMASQYIENKEGLIYFDGKGDTVIYSKIFSYANQHNRLQDLYCLNFMTGSRDVFAETGTESLSHSIDPINPMIGNDEYFNQYFGRLGIVIHSILKEIHKKGQLMDVQSLKSILMLNNLISWSKNKKFTSNELTEYLIEIGISFETENDEDDFNDALLKHAEQAHTAYKTMNLFTVYPHVFRIDCSINIEKIFLERKMLLILLPALEKSVIELANLGSLITSQIKYVEEKYQRYNMHFQNIIIDEFTYFAENLQNLRIDISKNNYIFACMDYGYDNKIFNYVLNNASTSIIMKYCEGQIHNKVKLDLMNNIEELPKLTYKKKNTSFIQNFVRELNDLTEGKAFILGRNYYKNSEEIINNDFKYYCEKITCEYIPAKKEKKIWLVKHPKPLIYIKENN